MSITKEKGYNGIIIFGEMGCGKDILADELQKLDKRCCKYNISKVIRQFFSITKVNPDWRGKDRFLGQDLADKLRAVYPEILNDYCLSLIYEKWEHKYNFRNDNTDKEGFNSLLLNQLSVVKESEIPIIVGGRTLVDFQYWSNKNFLTVGITCDEQIRYSRLCTRDGLEVAKNSNFKHNTEAEVGNISKNKCDIVIDNSKDLDHLISQAEELLRFF